MPHLRSIKKYLSENSKRLLDVSIKKGVSNWLLALLISDLVSSYRSNIFRMQFAYGMDGALQRYQQRAPVVLDLVCNIA